MTDIYSIKPVIHPPEKPTHRAWELFPTEFSNILCLAPKNSGKTCVINHIVKHKIPINTSCNVMLFSPTFEKDPTAMDLVSDMRDRPNITLFTANDIIEETDHIRNFLRSNTRIETEAEPVDQSMILMPGMCFIQSAPEISYDDTVNIIILDDMGVSLRKPSVEQLVKTSRHTHTTVIMAAQHLNDCSPAVLRNIDFFLLFAGLSMKKIEELWRKITLSIDLHEFIRIYQNATEEKYSFLYVDVKRNGFRKNFRP